MSNVNPRIMFGNRLDVWQHEHGYSSLDVAKILGVTPSAVSGWRTGRNIPCYSMISKLGSLGMDISNIKGVPSEKVTPEYIKNFCKNNNINMVDLCMAAGVSKDSIYRFIRTNESKAIDALARIESFIEEYENPKGEYPATEQSKEEVEEIMELEDIVESNETLENTTRELPSAEPVEIVTGLNAPAKRSYNKKVTLRELLAFADKFNIMDAEIRTDGGFGIIGFKLIVEEDGVPNLALKTTCR